VKSIYFYFYLFKMMSQWNLVLWLLKWNRCGSRDSGLSTEVLKMPRTIFFLHESPLAGQKRHFQRVKRNAWAYSWCIFLVWKTYASSVISLWSWPKFHFDFGPFKVSIFNRSTSRLKIQIYIRFLYFWIEERMMYLWAKRQNGNDFHCCVRAC